MKVIALVWNALVLASLHHEVRGQDECGSWMQSSYAVSESDGLVTLTAQLSNASAENLFLLWATRDDSATGNTRLNYIK